MSQEKFVEPVREGNSHNKNIYSTTPNQIDELESKISKIIGNPKETKPSDKIDTDILKKMT